MELLFCPHTNWPVRGLKYESSNQFSLLWFGGKVTSAICVAKISKISEFWYRCFITAIKWSCSLKIQRKKCESGTFAQLIIFIAEISPTLGFLISLKKPLKCIWTADVSIGISSTNLITVHCAAPATASALTATDRPSQPRMPVKAVTTEQWSVRKTLDWIGDESKKWK